VRLLPLTGVAFAVLGILNVVLTDLPDLGDSRRTTAAFYASASHRHKEIVGAYLGVAAAIAFLLFVAAVAARVRARRPELATISLVAAGAFAAVATVAQASFLAPTASVSLGFSSAETVDPGFAREASTLADPILFGGAALGGLAVVAASLALGGPLRWLGVATGGLTLLATFTFFPLLLMPLWAAGTGVTLAVRR